MKKHKVLLPLLLIIALFACEEQSNDTAPASEESASLLTRRVRTSLHNNESVTTEYSYQDGLLVRRDIEGAISQYFYENRRLSRVESQVDFLTTITTFSYTDNSVSWRMETFDSAQVYVATVREHLFQADGRIRMNRYLDTENQMEFSGHSIISVVDGNITQSIEYDVNGNELSRSEITFGTGLNPFALWEGHPLQNKNLNLRHELFENGEFSYGTSIEEVVLNADNLPTELIARPLGTNASTFKVEYFYD